MERKNKKNFDRRNSDKVSMLSLPDLLKKATSLTPHFEEEEPSA